MLSKKHFALLSPEQQQAVLAFEKETSVSNINQAQLGKRIAFNDKSFGVVTFVEKVDAHVYLSGKTETIETVATSKVLCSGKESLLLKTIKDVWN